MYIILPSSCTVMEELYAFKIEMCCVHLPVCFNNNADLNFIHNFSMQIILNSSNADEGLSKNSLI